MSVKTYSIALLILACSIVCSTAIFKYKTGSFLTISESSKKEIIIYELNKRKKDISIVSIKKSCLNFDNLLDTLLMELDNSNSNYITTFSKSLQNVSRDSSYFKIIEKMYENAYYYEETVNSNGREIQLYAKPELSCEEVVTLSFQKVAQEEKLVAIKNLPNYLTCSNSEE